jgi:RHS repeat-associated protein
VVNRIVYDAFGQIESIADPSNNNAPLAQAATRFLFTGQEYDGDIALYYYNARWDDAHTGTFLSRDPLGLTPDVNPYRYVGNVPTNAIDPTGRVQVTIYADAFIPMAKVLNPMLNGYLKGDDREISATPAPEEKSRAGNWIIVETDARIEIVQPPFCKSDLGSGSGYGIVLGR